jgi:hypothetical protein
MNCHAPNRSHCHACNKRSYRKRHAMRDAYQHLKDNSKRRGIYFDLTFEQFAEFCFETEYLTRRGRSRFSYSVDRIREELGYTAGNLQRLTIADNTRKENARRQRVKIMQFDYATKKVKVLNPIQR